jgi:uncharacterized membrane protein
VWEIASAPAIKHVYYYLSQNFYFRLDPTSQKLQMLAAKLNIEHPEVLIMIITLASYFPFVLKSNMDASDKNKMEYGVKQTIINSTIAFLLLHRTYEKNT